jgi:hypothetical protein
VRICKLDRNRYDAALICCSDAACLRPQAGSDRSHVHTRASDSNLASTLTNRYTYRSKICNDHDPRRPRPAPRDAAEFARMQINRALLAVDCAHDVSAARVRKAPGIAPALLVPGSVLRSHLVIRLQLIILPPRHSRTRSIGDLLHGSQPPLQQRPPISSAPGSLTIRVQNVAASSVSGGLWVCTPVHERRRQIFVQRSRRAWWQQDPGRRGRALIYQLQFTTLARCVLKVVMDQCIQRAWYCNHVASVPWRLSNKSE